MKNANFNSYKKGSAQAVASARGVAAFVTPVSLLSSGLLLLGGFVWAFTRLS